MSSYYTWSWQRRACSLLFWTIKRRQFTKLLTSLFSLISRWLRGQSVMSFATAFEMSSNSCITRRQINHGRRTHSRLKNYFLTAPIQCLTANQKCSHNNSRFPLSYFSLSQSNISYRSRIRSRSFSTWWFHELFFPSHLRYQFKVPVSLWRHCFFTLPSRTLISLSHWGK